jgi:hypothetical protein
MELRPRVGRLPVRQRSMGINTTEILLCREWLGEDADEALVLISAMGVLQPDDSAVCGAAALILIGPVIDIYAKKPPLFIGPRIQNGLAFWHRRFVIWNESIRNTILDHGHVVSLHGVKTTAFYDCTTKQTTRITVGGVLMPLVIFNGHHRINALKFGALVGPSCDIVDLSISVEARVHDQRVEGEFSELDARFG